METKNIRLLRYSILALLSTAFLHITALKFYLYWNFPWLDLLVHFLGGFSVLGLFLYFFKFNKKYQLFIFVLVITLVWEFFELYYGVADFNSPNFLFDSVLDVVMGFVGAGFAYSLSQMGSGVQSKIEL